MKKHFQISLLILICLMNFENAFSQNRDTLSYTTCKKASLRFYTLAKAKDYKKAYQPWLWFIDNCNEIPKYGYTYGVKILEDRYKSSFGKQKEEVSILIDSIYENRVLQFPENLGKVYSDWGSSLQRRNTSKEIVFEKLELAFKADPTKMSIKNLVRYFQEFTDKNKNSDTQKVFDVYDDVLEAVNTNIDYHSKALDSLNTKVNLSDKEKIKQKNHQINLRGLGQVENVLGMIISEKEVSNCEQLIILYSENLESKKDDVKWLRRAVSRLNTRECVKNKLYPKLIEAYIKVDNSPDGIICYIGSPNYVPSYSYPNNLIRSIKAEKDPYKRAEYYYKIGRIYIKSSPSTAASYARKALTDRPSMGKAYILIAEAYASSANACGKDEFSKRMVFVAAADKAKKAKEVDPSVISIANKYIKAYMANAPSKHILNLSYGKEFQIKCWIGETVIIP